MRFLVDESLQQGLVGLLGGAGHQATHVLDLGMGGAPDAEVLGRALAEDRIVVTADTDFGTLLALSGAAGPSVILLRRGHRRTRERASVILDVLSVAEDRLRGGAVVTIDEMRIRIRRLPIERA